MKRIAYWSLVVIVLALAAIPVIYSLGHLFDKAYRDSFLGNWAATVIGVVVGIPIALELNRHEIAAEARRAAEAKLLEENQRRSKILGLLRAELVQDRDQLKSCQPAGAASKRTVLLPGLKDELWHAFSDGGELQWLQDPDLIDVLCDRLLWRSHHYLS